MIEQSRTQLNALEVDLNQAATEHIFYTDNTIKHVRASMKIIIALVLLFSLCLIASCDSGVSSPRGFSLPKGDSIKGQQVFIKHQCLSCHDIEGLDGSEIDSPLDRRIALGGDKSATTTYAFLVTSVINPSHQIAAPKNNKVDIKGDSKMRPINDQLTVSELIDLVTYLETKYDVQPYKYTPYSYYPIN